MSEAHKKFFASLRECLVPLGPLRQAFLTWISEFPIGCLLMCVRHVWPELALTPETSKKNKRLSEWPYSGGQTESANRPETSARWLRQVHSR
jgi:hypothetical protein